MIAAPAWRYIVTDASVAFRTDGKVKKTVSISNTPPTCGESDNIRLEGLLPVDCQELGAELPLRLLAGPVAPPDGGGENQPVFVVVKRLGSSIKVTVLTPDILPPQRSVTRCHCCPN